MCFLVLLVIKVAYDYILTKDIRKEDFGGQESILKEKEGAGEIL